MDEGTIDQGQAEAVADTLAEALPRPHGPMGHGLEAIREAADFLGLDRRQELAEALRDGQTLAEIAVANGSTADALIDHLVGLVEEHLTDLVADGRITEEREGRHARAHDRAHHRPGQRRDRAALPRRGAGPGMGGPGMGGPGGDDAADTDATTRAPEASPAPLREGPAGPSRRVRPGQEVGHRVQSRS